MTLAGPDARTGTPFRFDYDPATIRFGAGCVADLADELDAHGLDRALVVCGQTVGTTPEVIDPVRDGLGDKLAGVFAETTPEKRLSTAFDARDALRKHDADVIVSLGGGSSLDVAKVASALAGDVREPEQVGAELVERGTISIPESGLTPIVAIPTTLAGADLTQVAGVTADPAFGVVDESASGGISSRRLMPTAVCYDPELVATTPESILRASAMNGFDKGLETLYASTATPITDATAVRGLQLLAPGLRQLGEYGPSADTLEPVLEGTMLVQYGISRPDALTVSLIHSFGHALTRTYDVQQGAAHGVVAPYALDYLFDEVDGRRDLLTTALDVATTPQAGPDEQATAIVDEVTAVRDALGLPTRLRDVAGPEPDEFSEVARNVVEDSFMANTPPGLDATPDAIEAVLKAAW